MMLDRINSNVKNEAVQFSPDDLVLLKVKLEQIMEIKDIKKIAKELEKYKLFINSMIGNIKRTKA